MAKQKKSSPTMMDVALRADVAVSTVSHVLNGTASITPQTQQKVLQAVKDLNYTPNAMARGLRQRHTNMIGLMVPDIANQFYAECASGVLESTHLSQTVLICNSNYDSRREEAHVQTLLERRVDGIIFFGGLDPKVIQLSLQKRVPTVLADRQLEGVCSVTFDNQQPLRQLMEQLAGAGVHRVGYLSEPLTMQNVAVRYETVQQAAAEYGLQLQQRWTVIHPQLQLDKMENAQQLVSDLLAHREPPPQVLITSNDLIALGAIRALQAAGLKVPQDIGVTGIDDIPMAKYASPALTTIRQQPRRMGKTSLQLLQQLIHPSKQLPAASHTVLPCELVLRDSVQL